MSSTARTRCIAETALLIILFYSIPTRDNGESQTMRPARQYLLTILLIPTALIMTACGGGEKTAVSTAPATRILRPCYFRTSNYGTEQLVTNGREVLELDTDRQGIFDVGSLTPETLTWDETELKPGDSAQRLSASVVKQQLEQSALNTVVEMKFSEQAIHDDVHGLYGVKFLKNPPPNQQPCPPKPNS